MTLPATPWYHCQGQIVSFSATSKGCKECPLAKECAIEVRQRLLSLQERIDVTKLLHGVQTFLDRHGVPRSPVKVELVKAGKSAEAKPMLDELAGLGDRFSGNSEVNELLQGSK